MKLVPSLCLATVLWLCLVSLARADNSTPIPAATTAPVSTPLAPPPVVADTSAPSTETPPVVYPTPLTVAREHNTPVSTVSAPPAIQPTAGPETGPTSNAFPEGQSSGPTSRRQPGTSSGNTGLPGSTSPGDVSGAGANSPVAVPGLSSVYDPVSAQGPSQLACHGKHHADSGPFLESPYSGWTEVVSFVDHDSPDYQVDGKIVLANGLTAAAADGQASDLFPAYWSSALRQYINYDGHNGYDFDISYQPVLAAAGGSVAYAGWNESDPYSGYGQMVLINHHDGYATLYGHLSKVEVRSGDRVTQGEEIGISGSTGHSSGPHLHFSVFHDCQVTDPYGWTGTGPDPLTAFDGERAGYLWLPARDPLLLNPPPGWPAYPFEAQLPGPAAYSPAATGTRVIPPADRLLLLSLPVPAGHAEVSPGTALARTAAWITQEANVLGPQLDALARAGAINHFQVIPAAGAIWVRGRATAAQLESLPGVASLTGVQPSDLQAAQVGLTHAVLIQIGHQHAPSLWPVGFRSGLHAWRSVTTVVNDDALVAGFALPGAHIVVSLRRGNRVPAAAATTADSSSGGFVAMLHDGPGNPVAVRAGDIVEFSSGGRTSRMVVHALTVSARSQHAEGTAPSSSTVSLSPIVNERPLSSSVATSTASGHFVRQFTKNLPAGSLVVGSIQDAASNQESAAGFVPGIDVTEGSNGVRGWTVGNNPHLIVTRNAGVLVDTALHPSPDGSFDVALQRHGVAFVLRPGDTVKVGSSSRGHAVHLVALTSHLQLGSHRLMILAPPGLTVGVHFDSVTGQSWSRSVPISRSVPTALPLPAGAARAGDSVVLRYVTPRGDIVEAIDELRALTVHRGSDVITGLTRPGALLSIRVVDMGGRLRGAALAGADARSGVFKAVLTDATGHPASLSGAIRVIVHEGGVPATYLPPRLAVRLKVRTGMVTGKTQTHAHLTVTLRRAGVSRTIHGVSAGDSGSFHIQLHPAELSAASRLTVTLSAASGLTVERSTSFGRRVDSRARDSARASTCKKHAVLILRCHSQGAR